MSTISVADAAAQARAVLQQRRRPLAHRAAAEGAGQLVGAGLRAQALAQPLVDQVQRQRRDDQRHDRVEQPEPRQQGRRQVDQQEGARAVGKQREGQAHREGEREQDQAGGHRPLGQRAAHAGGAALAHRDHAGDRQHRQREHLLEAQRRPRPGGRVDGHQHGDQRRRMAQRPRATQLREAAAEQRRGQQRGLDGQQDQRMALGAGVHRPAEREQAGGDDQEGLEMRAQRARQRGLVDLGEQQQACGDQGAGAAEHVGGEEIDVEHGSLAGRGYSRLIG
jgi:hypothetical protein